LGPNKGTNSDQNRRVRGIAAKHGLTAREARKLSKEVHAAKKSASYDLDINGNLDPADIEDMAKEILKDRGH
jgi:hypothetical protein